MYVILSPAKKLDFDSPWDRTLPFTEPVFLKDASSLCRVAKRLKARDLAALMDLSEALAELNRERFADWEVAHTPDNARPAALAFAGDVYTGLEAPTWSADALVAAQDQLGILSGLYGLLRPLDLIQPYRLEMGTALETRRGKNLYAYWGDTIAKELRRRVEATAPPVLLNLASNEYFKAANTKALKVPVLEARFVEVKEGKPQMMMVFAKRARGLMARWVLEQRPGSAEDLKAFDVDRYRFVPEASDGSTLTFSREFIPVGR
jgi:cytoplasmic iron level regulating protein YaaA (DUF328/UPF0246 family)